MIKKRLKLSSRAKISNTTIKEFSTCSAAAQEQFLVKVANARNAAFETSESSELKREATADTAPAFNIV